MYLLDSFKMKESDDMFKICTLSLWIVKKIWTFIETAKPEYSITLFSSHWLIFCFYRCVAML